MREGGVKLPFSSARFGRRPLDTNEGRTAWSIANNYPLSKDRDYVGMAAEMYNRTARNGGATGLQAQSEDRRLTQNPNQAVDAIPAF